MEILSHSMTVHYDDPADFGDHYRLVHPVGWVLTGITTTKNRDVVESIVATYTLGKLDQVGIEE